MFYDLCKDFNLHTDKDFVQVNGSYTFDNNELKIVTEKNHTSSFHINFLTKVNTKYFIEMYVILKDLSETNSNSFNNNNISSRKRFENDLTAKASLIVETRKSSMNIKKLLDQDVNLTVNKFNKANMQHIATSFTALTDQTIIGMIISHGFSELKVNHFIVKEISLTDNTDTEYKEDYINDTFSHVTSSESILFNNNINSNINNNVNNKINDSRESLNSTKDKTNLVSKIEENDNKEEKIEKDQILNNDKALNKEFKEESNAIATSKSNKGIYFNTLKRYDKVSSSSNINSNGNNGIVKVNNSGSNSDSSDSDSDNVSDNDDVSNNDYQNKIRMKQSVNRNESDGKIWIGHNNRHELSDISSSGIDYNKDGEITIKGINRIINNTYQINASADICVESPSTDKCCDKVSCIVGQTGPTGPIGPTGPAGNSIFAITINWQGVQVECLTSQKCISNVVYVLESRNCEVGLCKLWECQNGVLQWLPHAFDNSVNVNTKDSAKHAYADINDDKCGKKENALWFYDKESHKLFKIVDRTCELFVGEPNDKILDVENGTVYEANSCNQWIPLSGSLKGPSGKQGTRLYAINTENLGSLKKGCHGLSGKGLGNLPDAVLLDENTLFYDTLTNRILINAGNSYGYPIKTWVLISDLSKDTNQTLLRNDDNTFYDESIPMLWKDNKEITSFLTDNDYVIDTFTGNQFVIKNNTLSLIGSLKGPEGNVGPRGEQGKGIYKQALLQVSSSDKNNLIQSGNSQRICLSKNMPIFYKDNEDKEVESLFNLKLNRIEVPNYLKGPVLIKLSLYVMIKHAQNLPSSDKIGIAVKKVSSLADWTLQTIQPNFNSGETFISITEIFTGMPGDAFEIQLRNITTQPISITLPQLAAGNRLFIEFNPSF